VIVMEFEKEIIERISKVEEQLNQFSKRLDRLDNKINGYLDQKIKINIKAFIGEIVLASIISGGLMGGIVAWILKILLGGS